MRLNRYLNEAAIQPDRTEVKIFEKAITDVYKEFIKTKSKYPKTRTGVNRAMKAAATKISKAIKDLKVTFKVTKSWNLKGGVQAGNVHDFYMEYNTEDAFDDWTTSEYMFEQWLDSFINLIKHELVHVEQFRRIKAAKGDIEKVKDILFDTRERAEKRYHGNMEIYLATHIEIMAHAKQAADQLKHYDKEDLLRMLKNEEDLEELGMESSAFDSYYSYMRDDYPKVWRKFLKNILQYIEKK